jgi:hypothetical protein
MVQHSWSLHSAQASLHCVAVTPRPSLLGRSCRRDDLVAVLHAPTQQLRHLGLHVFAVLKKLDPSPSVSSLSAPRLHKHVLGPERSLMAHAVEAVAVLERIDTHEVERGRTAAAASAPLSARERPRRDASEPWVVAAIRRGYNVLPRELGGRFSEETRAQTPVCSTERS